MTKFLSKKELIEKIEDLESALQGLKFSTQFFFDKFSQSEIQLANLEKQLFSLQDQLLKSNMEIKILQTLNRELTTENLRLSDSFVSVNMKFSDLLFNSATIHQYNKNSPNFYQTLQPHFAMWNSFLKVHDYELSSNSFHKIDYPLETKKFAALMKCFGSRAYENVSCFIGLPHFKNAEKYQRQFSDTFYISPEILNCDFENLQTIFDIFWQDSDDNRIIIASDHTFPQPYFCLLSNGEIQGLIKTMKIDHNVPNSFSRIHI